MKQNKLELKSLSVKGYKSLGRKISINIAPLTILSGVNSSGKSSFFQPFLLLKQTNEIQYSPEGILLDGANIKIFDAKSIFSEKNPKKKRKLELAFYFSDKTSIKNIYSYQKNLDIMHCEFKYDKELYSFSHKSISRTIENIISLDDDGAEFLKDSLIDIDGYKYVASKTRGFYEFYVTKKSLDFLIQFPMFDVYSKRLAYIQNFVRIWHIPGIRGNPERYYKSASTKNYLGRFENYTASILQSWCDSNTSASKGNLKKLTNLLVKLGLTSSIVATKPNDASIEIKVGSLPNVTDKKSDINIADVGFGVSQILPILVALIAAPNGKTIYIEQPELHLHPRAQATLGEIFAKFIKEKKITLIMETHSSIMIRKIQTLIANKTLKKEDVSLNWFEMQNDGFSKATSAKLDDKGRTNDWPQDFDDVHMDVEAEYIRSVHGLDK